MGDNTPGPSTTEPATHKPDAIAPGKDATNTGKDATAHANPDPKPGKPGDPKPEDGPGSDKEAANKKEAEKQKATATTSEPKTPKVETRKEDDKKPKEKEDGLTGEGDTEGDKPKEFGHDELSTRDLKHAFESLFMATNSPILLPLQMAAAVGGAAINVGINCTAAAGKGVSAGVKGAAGGVCKIFGFDEAGDSLLASAKASGESALQSLGTDNLEALKLPAQVIPQWKEQSVFGDRMKREAAAKAANKQKSEMLPPGGKLDVDMQEQPKKDATAEQDDQQTPQDDQDTSVEVSPLERGVSNQGDELGQQGDPGTDSIIENPVASSQPGSDVPLPPLHEDSTQELAGLTQAPGDPNPDTGPSTPGQKQDATQKVDPEPPTSTSSGPSMGMGQ